MNNFWHKINYTLINVFNLTPSPVEQYNYDRIYFEEFRTMNNWANSQPTLINNNRTKGIVMSIKILNDTSFIIPSIISRTTIEGGCVSIKAKISPSKEIAQLFTLRRKDSELGFKIIHNTVHLINPVKAASVHLFKPNAYHLFEIEIIPEDDMVLWHIDGITVHKIHFASPESKHLTIALTPLKKTINAKEFPINCYIKNVDFLAIIPSKPITITTKTK